jgi:hypothetical protein
MTPRPYLDELPLEHVQQGAQLRSALNRLAAREKRVETLEAENTKLWKRVKGNEAAAPV